jgi:hypothetical protein
MCNCYGIFCVPNTSVKIKELKLLSGIVHFFGVYVGRIYGEKFFVDLNEVEERSAFRNNVG